MIESISDPMLTINAGNGSNPVNPTYCREELDPLKQRPGFSYGKQIPVIYHNTETVGLIGVDPTGADMTQGSDKIVLPCPPYCPEGDCTDMTTAEAIAYLGAP